LVFLLVPPAGLAGPLFGGEFLIIFLELLQLLLLLHGHLVFEHASHPGYAFSLLCVLSVLGLAVFFVKLVLAGLLLDPLLLESGVSVEPSSVD